MKQQSELNMTSGSLFKPMLLFSLPIMAMNLLQLLFNAADMVVVGRFAGADSLAAVGATGALINLLVNLFMGLSIGASVIVAQDYGAGNYGGVSRSVHTSIYVSIIGGFLVAAIGIIFCRPLLILMGTPEDILEKSVLYMRIYFIGMPANLVYNFGAAILRAVGDSKRPMYFLIISGVVNVLVNLIFVIGLHMTVDGVAWATVISQYLSVILLMICLIRSETCIKFMIREMRMDPQKLKDLIRIGLPAGFQGSLFSISNVLIQSAVNSFGSTVVAASSAAGNIEGLVFTSMNAYYTTAITFTGQNYGAGKPQRIDSIFKVCILFVFATWILLGGLVTLLGETLMGIYSSDPEVISFGIMKLHIMMVIYFTCGTMNTIPGIMRGMGYSIAPMLITLIGTCALRVVWVYTVFAWFPTLQVLYWCYPVTWTVSGIGHVVSYFMVRKAKGISAPLPAESAQ